MVEKKPTTLGGLILCMMIPFLETDQSFGLMAILLLGFIDDVADLKPFPKLVCETYVAWFVTGSVGATIWVVFFMNAMNLSDNMDGLAIGLGVISALFLEKWILCFLLLSVLPANFPNARVYLGDLGSLSLGYVLALSVLEHSTVIPILNVALPIVDTGFVVLSRLKRRRSPLKGGRDHLSHILARKVGKTWAVVALWGIGLGVAIIGRVWYIG